MKVDLEGRVKNLDLPKTKPLLPLLEAVSNSIHAIEDAGTRKGLVTIRIVRDEQFLLHDTPESRSLAPIVGFEIADNGEGFTKANYESFQTCDSLHKQARGAKGIGRLLWLKAFAEVEVESTFMDEAGTPHLRRFKFSLPKGVVGHKTSQSNSTERKTVLRLKGFEETYASECPKKTSTIAERMVIHLVTNFLNPNVPRIELRDDASPDLIVLNEKFKEYFQKYGSTDGFKVGEHSFAIHHLRLFMPEPSQNCLQLAAGHYDVEEIPLKNRIPGLAAKLTDPDGSSFSYLGVVSGALLDQRVNSTRTGFNLQREGDLPEKGVPTLDQIVVAATERALAALGPFLESIRKKTRTEVEHLVQGEYPAYRSLMPQIEQNLDSFPPGASPNVLLKKINEIQFEAEQETREQSKAMLGKTQVDQSDEFKARFKAYLARLTRELEARLAQYVTHRRAILDLLVERLKLRDDENYALEEAIHELIFPLKATSDEPGVWGHQNLWLIDERLAYHRYLASDVPLRSQEAIVCDSSERPDFLIINRPGAFSPNDQGGTPHTAVTIIELKRPGRMNKGSDKKDPVEQALEYVVDVKAGKVRDTTGRLIRASGAAFYVYVVCDFEDGSDFDKAASLRGLTKSPDGRGYFGFIPAVGAYVEVISFDKLVDDATQRNRILFQRLGIDAPLAQSELDEVISPKLSGEHGTANEPPAAPDAEP